MTKREWWWPTLVDAAYFARLRKDYPDAAHESDEGLRYRFDVHGKYADTWDHVGDAREDWEWLADDWYRLKALAGEPTDD